MIEQGRGGKVIPISSARGELGMSNYSAYAPSKAAINLLTHSPACEWGKYGINVNAIAPMVFRTALTQWMFDDQAVYKNFVSWSLDEIVALREHLSKHLMKMLIKQ